MGEDEAETDRAPIGRARDGQADLAAMRAVASGSDGALSALMAREGPALLRFARGLLQDEAEAEDVVQDCFVRLWENAAAWRPEARIRAWLHRVCYNRAIDQLRRRRGHLDIAETEIVDETAAPEHDLVEAEGTAMLRCAIDRLPHRQRAAVLLFHIQDLSQAEAAAILEVSEDALESLLARGRRQLRRILDAAHEDE